MGLRKSMQRLTQTEMDEEVFVSASKIRSSAAFGEIIILIVYIPILTLIGIEGKMFTPMAKNSRFCHFRSINFIAYLHTNDVCFVLPKKINHNKTLAIK